MWQTKPCNPQGCKTQVVLPTRSESQSLTIDSDLPCGLGNTNQSHGIEPRFCREGKGSREWFKFYSSCQETLKKTHYTDKSIYDIHLHFYATFLYFIPMHYISQTFMIYPHLLIAVILGFELQWLQCVSRITAGFVFSMETCSRNWAGNDVWKTNKNWHPSTVKKITDIICMVLFCTYI